MLYVLMLALPLSLQAKGKGELTKTSFKVWGNCDQCKKRIEKAAKVDGVKTADWNVDTQIMTVSFHPEKISLDKIEQHIAKAGHDTEKFKADDKDYLNLPKCCQYDRK